MNRKKRKASGGRATNSSQMMPALWRTLPKELLLLVFSRLPLPDITRVRSLSKEWNRDMAIVNSDINRACDEARPRTVAVCSSRYSEILVSICAPRSQYSYRLHLGDGGWDDMGACDGGLVCFVSTSKPSKANPLCIVVVNLLTGVQRKLPPLKYVYSTPPQMMHIEVDSQTKSYRVVVVGKNMKGGRPTVEIYDSGARQWTKKTPPVGSIFGVDCGWYKTSHGFCNAFTGLLQFRIVYDFAEGRLRRCDENVPASHGASVQAFVIQGDCLLVLYRNTSNGEMLPAEACCITKYRRQNNAKDWVQERSYLCSPFEEDFRLWRLQACEGFLMVIDYVPCGRINFFLLDLSTGEWSRPSNFFEGHGHRSSISRAFWNVVP